MVATPTEVELELVAAVLVVAVSRAPDQMGLLQKCLAISLICQRLVPALVAVVPEIEDARVRVTGDVRARVSLADSSI